MGMSQEFDLITMGRSGIDLYSNDIGAPFVEIKSFAAYVGGSSTNIAVGAQRLGLRTALVTAVGADPVGDFILHFLEREGVETKYIPRKPGTRSGAALLSIEPPDKFPLVFYRDNAADIQLTIDDVRALPLAQCRVFQFGGNNFAQDPARSATLYAIEQARRAGVTIVMDVDFRADQWRDPRAFGVAVRAVLPMVDIVIGTEAEIKAAMMTELSQLRVTDSQVSAPEVSGDLDAAIDALLQTRPRLLALKRGAQGCTLYQPDAAPRDVPGFRVEVLNVLGAGDAFASGLIYGYVRGWDWERAARFANACGAILVTRHACGNDAPRLDEVERFMMEHEGMQSAPNP
jgi:5-dehydro-2-deoxygluconokinase